MIGPTGQTFIAELKEANSFSGQGGHEPSSYPVFLCFQRVLESWKGLVNLLMQWLCTWICHVFYKLCQKWWQIHVHVHVCNYYITKSSSLISRNGGRYMYVIITSPNQPGLPDFSHISKKKWEILGMKLGIKTNKIQCICLWMRPYPDTRSRGNRSDLYYLYKLCYRRGIEHHNPIPCVVTLSLLIMVLCSYMYFNAQRTHHCNEK